MNRPAAYHDSLVRCPADMKDEAENYIAQTMIGDPELDPIMEELSSMPTNELHRYIEAGIEQQDRVFRAAPRCLRDFFDSIDEPAWVDHKAFGPGIRAFQNNVVKIFAAFVAGVLIDGFSTRISKSFVQTGRIFDDGVGRLRQNNRQQIEIFWPGGLMRESDGWKLSVRIRFVHARVRYLLARSGEWDVGVHGTPISAAHMGYSLACFSARTLKHSATLGARYTREEREGFCAVWRYAGYLMGIPESIMYQGEQDALKMYRVGMACEPEPDVDAVVMANALINSAPLVAGITDKVERAELVQNIIYPVSRLLIGNELADKLNFPRSSRFRMIRAYLEFRFDNALKSFRERMFRKGGSNLITAFGASLYSNTGTSYKLPDHVHAERSSEW